MFSNVSVYAGQIFVYFVLHIFVWTIFVILAIALFRRSHKAVRQEQITTVRALKRDLAILGILSVLLGVCLAITTGFVLASRAIQNGLLLFIAGDITALTQGPSLFLLHGLRLREVRQLWCRWVCCHCIKSQETVDKHKI